jgi:hypothetical protein
MMEQITPTLMIVAVIAGSVASIATCGFVVFIFKRLYTNHDKLAQAVETLSVTLSEFKLYVTGKYITAESCLKVREGIDKWKEREEDERREFEEKVNQRLYDGAMDITRLQERVENIANEIRQGG